LRSPALAPFQVRSFRFQWPADLAVSWAFEMETLILGWYVLTETGSVRLLVLFGALQYLGALLSPLFGVAGDRIGHRNLMCVTRALYAAMAAVLLLLALSGALTPLRVFAVAAIVGLVRPSDLMMRNALIAQTMTSERLLGALGLSRVTADSARIAGALSGAGVVAAFGIGQAYAVILCLYAISFSLTLGVSRVNARGSAGATMPTSPWGDLRHVVEHILRTPELKAALGIALLANAFAYPFVLGLLPFVAREIYGVGQTGLGSLSASFAIGSLIGSMALSMNRMPLRPARTMIVAAAAWLALTIALAHTRTLTEGAIVLAFAGAAQSFSMVPLAAVMLRSGGEGIRGRVMGMRMLAILGLPLGLLIAGPLIDDAGFTLTATLYAGIGLALTLAIAMRWRGSVWRAGAPANARW